MRREGRGEEERVEEKGGGFLEVKGMMVGFEGSSSCA